MSKKVAFYTLGCKLNFSETSTIGKQFIDNGYSIVDFSDVADVYVINTCTVTETAERECRQIIRRALRNNKDAFVAVTGCYAQIRAEDISKIEGVDAVFGTNDKFSIFDKINSFNKKESPELYVTSLNEIKDFYPAFSSEADSRTRAFLKIQDGCDYTCSYCTIPQARGKSRSASQSEIIKNLNTLIDNGYKEIVLVGVNIGTYGADRNDSFYSLLNNISNIDREFRIRIGSVEPNLITEDIVKLIKGNPKICPHFHIPLQSGSESILRKMQRRYNLLQFEQLLNIIHRHISYPGVGIDVIVGFPGETEKEFNETKLFLEKNDYAYLHVFSYSERPDTAALNTGAPVPHQTRKDRTHILRELSDKKHDLFGEKMIGKHLNVLFEHTVKGGKIKGFAENYMRVETEFREELINNLGQVLISDYKNKLCIA